MEKKRYSASLIWIVQIFLVLIAMIIAGPPGPPTPKNIAGFVLYGEEGGGVPDGTIVIINDTEPDPDLIVITYVDSKGILGLEGAYSVEIPGANTSDWVEVTSYNATAYGRSYENLTSTTTYVNVTLNITRSSETDLNITYPSNYSYFNISQSFYTNITLGIIGGQNGEGCSALISFTNDSIINVSSEETLNKILGDITLGSTIEAAWNISVNDIGTVNITVNSTCGSDGENFENKNWDAVYEITTQDLFPPVITLNNPANDTFFNYENITFYFSVTDDTSVANCTVILDDFINETNSSISITEENVLTVENLAEAWHNWTVNCTDGYDNEGTNETLLFFTVDTTPPNVDNEGPENDSISSILPVWFNWAATDNLDDTLMCNLTISNNLTNVDIPTPNGTLTQHLVEDLYDGYHEWNVSCWDNAINTNTSMPWYFNLSIPMRIYPISPENENITNIENTTFFYNITDNDVITNCTVLIDGIVNETNITEVVNGEINNITVELMSEGNHTWDIECTNHIGAISNSTEVRSFIVDINPPTIELYAPMNSSDMNTTSINFSWLATDEVDDTLVCNLTVDDVLQSWDVDSLNGTLTTSYYINLSAGWHEWNVTCWDNATNVNTSEAWNFNITLPDLSIVSSDINFNNTSPAENETVNISAVVYNLGDSDVLDVTVQFFDGNPDSGGLQINGNQSIEVMKGLSSTASVEYTPHLGVNNIFVIIDPPSDSNGSIEELNETNNQAENNFTVSSWHIIYGYLERGSFNLSESTYQDMFSWSITQYANSNIFVADSDSMIDFTSLQAIGRSIAGGSTGNDFSEIDSLLNMTGYADSVSTLFTTDGNTPINTTEYYLYNRNVTYIPITNSTNTTEFATGILWDYSDDSADGEFSEDDVEDLIFMTKVNPNTQGAYDLCDYEIRIPATLRRYKAEETSVSFYVELK